MRWKANVILEKFTHNIKWIVYFLSDDDDDIITTPEPTNMFVLSFDTHVYTQNKS